MKITKEFEVDYEDFQAIFNEVPKTWLPGLLIVLTEVATARNVFLPGKAATLVQGAEDRARAAVLAKAKDQS